MKFDRAIRKPTPAPRPEKPLSPIAARHREFLTYLTEEIGLTPYRISVTIDRNNGYVNDVLEKGTAPSDKTIDAYERELHLNATWMRTGKGRMISNLRELRKFAASHEHTKRPNRRWSD